LDPFGLTTDDNREIAYACATEQPNLPFYERQAA
jgi:hypothetical protein